jgi:hypothetical protein
MKITYGLLRRVVTHHPNDVGSKHLWNVCKRVPEYTAQKPWRQPSSSKYFLVVNPSLVTMFTPSRPVL